MDKSSTPYAVLVSSPGMGHLIPLLELANRLSTLLSFKATVLFVSSATLPQLAANQYSDVDLLEIPAADISNIVDPGAQVLTKICVLMREAGPSIRAAISGLKAPTPTVVVLDMFATEYLPIARELELPCFVYFPSSAWFLALTIYCPVLDKQVEGEYVDQKQPLCIPGCTPVRPGDVVDPMLQRSNPQYTEYMRMGVEIPLFDGVLTNTWQDLEGSTMTALRDGHILPVPVYDIGPIIAVPYRTGESDGMLMEWLDRQPARSVMYVSFGSGGTLSSAQLAELACGLELSQQRFAWVVRPPKDGDPSGTYLGLNGDVDNDVGKYLPRGFMEKTGDVGRVVSHWAPQLKVLSHPSVGGFLTHCGWNSIIESLTNGLPMVACPMYAEQRMNASMLVEELKVAVRACHLPGKTLVGREEIQKMVRMVIQGEKGRLMRLRAQELQRSAAQAMGHGGSSYNSLHKFAQTSKMRNSAIMRQSEELG